MSELFTPEEMDRIRPAFNTGLSGNTPGIISGVVLAQWEKHPTYMDLVEGHTEALKANFRAHSMHGVVSMIEILESPYGKGLAEVGSGSIMLATPREKRDTPEGIMGAPAMYVGDRKRGIKPLKWLGYLALSLDSIDSLQLKAFDLIIGEIAASIKRINARDFKKSTSTRMTT